MKRVKTHFVTQSKMSATCTQVSGNGAIGLLMLDTNFERIKGDIGNPNTFNFPVIIRCVKEVSANRVIEGKGKGLIDNFIKEAKYLIKHYNVKGITTSCGFLALHQNTLSNAIKSVPVFTSSLCQLPLLLSITSNNDKIAVITYNKNHLTSKHFYSIGVNKYDLKNKIKIYGMNESINKELFNVIKQDNPRIYNKIKAKQDLVELAKKAKLECGNNLKFILLECTNMGPYAYYIQKEIGVPVFDVTTLVNYMYYSMHRKPWTKL